VYVWRRNDKVKKTDKTPVHNDNMKKYNLVMSLPIYISNNDLQKSIEKAFMHETNTFVNMRSRNLWIQLDEKIRGGLGEIAIWNLLKNNKINVIQSNVISNKFEIDKDIVVSINNKEILIEIKTSLMPDCWPTMNDVISNADIKIYKYENDYHYVKHDVYVQIYFENLKRKERDIFLTKINDKYENPKKYSPEEIVRILQLENLKEVFIKYTTKKQLIKYLDSVDPKYRTWNCWKKTYWKCPLKFSQDANTFIECIQNW